MPDTKQFTILKRLTALLEGITPTNGYDYDLSGKVFRGRTVFGADQATPFISILEALRPDPVPMAAGAEKMIRVEEWELLLQGWAETSSLNPTDALYGLKGSMEKRLARMVLVNAEGNAAFPDDYRLGRIIAEARIGPGVVRPATPQTGGSEAIYLPLTICYMANVSDPWALS